MKKVAVYLRVSTATQTVENQRLELEAYCQRMGWVVTQTYEDSGISGTKYDRPALQKMLKDAAKGKFDVLMVWKIDRLARSTSDLLSILQQLKALGVDFISTTQSIDTTSSMGKMVLTFLGAIAEFERDTIVERVKCGIQRAKSEGVQLGRPRVGFDVNRVLAMKSEGYSWKQISKELKVSSATIRRMATPLLPKQGEMKNQILQQPA
jgi:DNA invertase Pin-like site-specific DNA recombinase